MKAQQRTLTLLAARLGRARGKKVAKLGRTYAILLN